MSASRYCCAATLLSLCSSFALADSVIYVSLTDDRFDPSCTTNCSLREAIYQANQLPDATTIVLRAGTYTITLNDPPYNVEEEPNTDENLNVRGDFDVQGELTIIGAGQGQTIIRSLGENTTGERLFDVLSGATFNLRRLTLRDGYSDTYGGAIRNNGQVLAQQVDFLSNIADAGVQGQGGAVANYGSFTVSQSLFEDNNSNGDEGFFGRGGAIFNMATLVVRDSTFRGNTVTDTDSDYGQGGAIYNEGTADISGSTFVNNDAGEPLFGGGGAAIANRQSGVLKVVNSTISGNPGIAVNGVLSNGIVSTAGGGSTSDTQAYAKLTNVTLAGNGGLGVSNVGTLVIRASLIAGNSLSGMPANCSNDGSYNMRSLLLGTDQGNCNSDVPFDDALTWNKVLYPLADNGGLTWTHALRKGGPAIDASAVCVAYDQRKVSRPRDGDGDGSAVCDLGSYERSRP